MRRPIRLNRELLRKAWPNLRAGCPDPRGLLKADISAQEALRMGLVNKVVPEGTVVREARNMARVLATKPSGSVQAILSMVQEGYGKPQTEALAMERDRFSKLVGTPDMREGLSAFIEKRKPSFQ